MRHRFMLVPLIACATVLGKARSVSQVSLDYTSEFGIDVGHSLSPDGGNDFLSLKPGTYRRYEGEDDSLPIGIEITVLDQTWQVEFFVASRAVQVLTRVVEEREWIDGELAQVSVNYLACCGATGNIYCLGENVDQLQGGVVVSHEGSWMAGERGARPGLQMPGFFLLGARYQLQLAPLVAMDRAEHIDMGLAIQTPAGSFRDCVAVLETTPLEPDEETLKVYAPGVGLVLDDDLVLVEYHNGKATK